MNRIIFVVLINKLYHVTPNSKRKIVKKRATFHIGGITKPRIVIVCDGVVACMRRSRSILCAPIIDINASAAITMVPTYRNSCHARATYLNNILTPVNI